MILFFSALIFYGESQDILLSEYYYAPKYVVYSRT